jgi:hypothetical protein
MRVAVHQPKLRAMVRVLRQAVQLRIVNAVGGDVYVSGAGGENYQTASAYAERGVRLEVRTCQPRECARSSWPFVPGLSVLDALFHQGRDSHAVMTYPDA